MGMKNAGKTRSMPSGLSPAGEAPTIVYPYLDIDLEKFPELEGDLGEDITLVIVARVKSKRLDDYSKSQCFDVIKIGRPEKAPKASKSMNEADQALENLTGKGSRY